MCWTGSFHHLFCCLFCDHYRFRYDLFLGQSRFTFHSCTTSHRTLVGEEQPAPPPSPPCLPTSAPPRSFAASPASRGGKGPSTCWRTSCPPPSSPPSTAWGPPTWAAFRPRCQVRSSGRVGLMPCATAQKRSSLIFYLLIAFYIGLSSSQAYSLLSHEEALTQQLKTFLKQKSLNFHMDRPLTKDHPV